MVTIVIYDSVKNIVIREVPVKDEATAIDVINNTKLAVRGINPNYDIKLKKDSFPNKNEAIEIIMKCVLVFATASTR